jgi:transcriptional regulator with XRE-family HTH domain
LTGRVREMGARRKISPAEDAFNQLVGAQIAAARKRNKLTQRRLAVGVGITQQMLAEIESGKSRCSPFTLARISVLLGVSVPSLMRNTTLTCIPSRAS